MLALLAADGLSGWPLCCLAQAGSGTVYNVLDKLEDLGWVGREQDAESDRAFYTLNSEGRAGVRLLLGLPAATPGQLRKALQRIPHPFALGNTSLRCACGLGAAGVIHDSASLLDTRAFLNGAGGPRERTARELAATMTPEASDGS